MKLSFDWLSDYVDLSGVNPQELADKLTMGAFEVEEVRRVGSDIQGPLVVGKILEISPHPNADKIRLTKVEVESGAEPLEIVCGAHNIEVGHLIPVALPGAKVINRKDGGELLIKAGAIRGVVSNGMLCSPPELGMGGDENAGILILSEKPDARFHEIGADLTKLLDLSVDYVLTVEPRSNRGDALSVIGLAREVAAILQRPLKQPAWSLEQGESDHTVEITIADHADCPYFSTRILTGLQLKPSPAHIQKRLEAVGVRCVNNVVDITNYVMHEYGQPLHAYDLRHVAGKRLGVRRARTGEKLTTIDAKERPLSDEVMVIADSERVVGVAGVMGGKDSEISDDTTDIVLEAACFHPARVRRGSRLLGLSSDSSLRFERGVDVASVARASDRAAYLMQQICGGKVGHFASAGEAYVKPVSVSLRLNQLKRIMDVDLSAHEVKELLEPLGFKTASDLDGHQIEIMVPSFRQTDVTREIDLVEEVCRLWGYDKLPVRMPNSTMAAAPQYSLQEAARDTLSSLGLSEAWLSSLVGGNEDSADSGREHHVVRVLNPLSADHQELRQSLAPGLIKAAAYNNDRGRKDVWLFEVGRTYKRASDVNGAEQDAFDSGTGVVESQQVGGLIMGNAVLSTWIDQSASEKTSQEAPADFYRVKGLVENLIARLGVNLQKVRFFRPEKASSYLHPSRSCQVAIDRSGAGKQEGNNQRPHGTLNIIGWIGELHPAHADKAGFKEKAYLFQLNLDALRPHRRKTSFHEIPTTPPLIRDLTVDIADAVDHAALHSCIVSGAGGDLEELELVSIYKPSPEQKSLSFRLTFQSSDKTLTSKEVDEKLARIRNSLNKRLGANFRE